MDRGELHWVDLPPAVGGHEQTGRRPALVVQANPSGHSTVVVVPFTTKMTALRFPYTVEIRPSGQNGLSAPSIALVFQVRAVDKKRLVGLAGHLESSILTQIDEILLRLLGLTA